MIWALLVLAQFTDPGDVQPDSARPVAAVVKPSDRIAARPRVFVYSTPNCAGCKKFATWLAGNRDTSFFEFEYKAIPEWVQSVPAFHWQANDGTWKVSYGWYGIAAFLKVWENNQVVVAKKQLPKNTGKEALPDTLRRFAGETGTIVFRPDRKTRAEVTSGVTLDIGEMTARYDLRGDPKIVFEDPQPRGTVEKFGFGVGFVLQSALYEPPSTVKVGTNWKTIRISLDDH